MATHTISGKRKTIWEIDEDNDTWVVAKNASIRTDDFAAVYENAPFSGNKFKILGDLTVYGFGDALWLEGVGSRAFIGPQATIQATKAIFAGGTDQRIVNEGELYGTAQGILSSGPNARIDNNGSIFGNIGIELYGDNSRVVNDIKGIITGEIGIATHADASVEIINKGMISASTVLLANDGTGPPGSVHLINTGKIYGIIELGDGDDIFDSLKGKAVTSIFGGDGDDAYLLSDAKIGIVEQSGEGNDTVRSTVSYEIFDNVENLTLLGKKNIDGDGNDGANILTGNKGRNTLSGLDGIDLLNGGKGNDTLDGSDDNVLDLYIFKRGTGTDTILLFEDGVDLIALASYDGVEDFGDITVAQDDADTLVTLLGGDRVRVKNFTATNLTNADFAFEIF